MKFRDKTIGIIGAGRVGTNLGYFLSRVSWHIKGVYDINTDAAKHLADIIPSGVHESIEMLAKRCEIIIITTPDDQIIDTTQIISEFSQSKVRYIFHTCGALSSRVLQNAGCEFGCGSFHPASPIPKLNKSHNPFANSIFAIDGCDNANELAIEIVRSLNASYFIIDPDKKVAYHTACALLSNNIFTILQSGFEILEDIGIDNSLARKLVKNLSGDAVNNFENNGLDALTGPIVRKDINTILEHFNVLDNFENKNHLNIYLETLRYLPNSEDIIKLVNQLREEKSE